MNQVQKFGDYSVQGQQELIGEGGNGQVYRATDLDGNIFALKVVNLARGNFVEKSLACEKEIQCGR